MMKKLFVLAGFVFGLLGLSAQSHPFYAGQMDSVIYTDYSNTTDWWSIIYAGGSYSVPIDLNEDGIDDCVANFRYSESGEQGGLWLNLQVLDSCWIFCAPNTRLQYSALQFNYGDTIPDSTIVSYGEGFTDTAKWLNGNVFVYDQTYGVCKEGWGGSSGGLCPYVFAKLLVLGDTLLGYIQISPSLISGWACQGIPSRDTIQVGWGVGINNVPAPGNIKLFPVPFNEQLNIQATGLTKYSLYNASGDLVLTGAKRQINTSTLAAGLYVIAVQSEAGVYYKKVVKTD